MVDVGLFISYILTGVCILVAIGMPLIKALGDPDSLKKIGIGVGSLVVVFLVSYFLADDTAFGNASVTTTKIVGAGLTMFYVLAIAAIVGIIYTEIKKAAQ